MNQALDSTDHESSHNVKLIHSSDVERVFYCSSMHYVDGIEEEVVNFNLLLY